MTGLDTLLLDAGNTVVYLDHDEVARLTGLDADALRRAEATAKRRYEELLREQGTHEDGWHVFMTALLDHAGARGDVSGKVRALRAAHDERNLWRRVPPGLRQALAEAGGRGWKLGIVSNSEGKLLDILREVGVAHLFDVVIDSGVVGVAKPDPRIFDLALSALGSSRDQAIYAGDVPEVDVEGARAAGIRAALIDTLDHYPGYTAAPRFRHTVELIGALLSGAGIR